MIDLLISFQICTSLNKKNLKRKHGHTSHLQWEHISVVNYLPSSDEAALLPPPFLTECHATWLKTRLTFSNLWSTCFLWNEQPADPSRTWVIPTCCPPGHPAPSFWQATPHPNFWHPSSTLGLGNLSIVVSYPDVPESLCHPVSVRMLISLNLIRCTVPFTQLRREGTRRDFDFPISAR